MVERRATAVWSPEALFDIDQIWNHYQRVAGRNTAEKITRGIAEVVAAIESYPFAGRSRDELRPGIRSLAAPPHVIFYRVLNEAPEIIRVLDGRQDIEEIFSDLQR
jgi:toxin ParE1/3/4